MKLLILSSILFLTGCDLTSSNPDEINYRKLVDKKAEFIGKGIKVPQADEKWDWLLPDLNSTAQKSSQAYEKPASSNGAKYLRSFKLYDEIGFVWSWQHQDLEVFLIYTFMGTNGYKIRTLHNTHNITVDEAILANYFDDEFSGFLQSFEVEKWQIKGIDDDYNIESLGFLGEEMFRENSEFELFDGRIITIPRAHVKFENNNYHLCNNYYSDGPCFELPKNFIDLLNEKNLANEVQNNKSLYYILKVKFGKNKNISKVLAGKIMMQKDNEERDHAIAEWLLHDGELGAASQPFHIESD